MNLEQQLYLDETEQEQRELNILKKIKRIDSGSNSTLYCNSIIFSGHRHGYIEHIYIQLQK